LKFGSLFAGIGGIDLGLERAGMECRWQIEIDDYARKVLAKHWPDVPRYSDITEVDGRVLEPVDLIAAGFPYQDISYARRGAGLDGERSGLFFETIRMVRQCQPRYVLLENVAALLTRGLDRVLGTLAEIGYDAEWHCISAASVGAPHIRDRVFIIAYAKGERWGTWRAGGASGAGAGEEDAATMADANEQRQPGCGISEKRETQIPHASRRGGRDETSAARNGREETADVADADQQHDDDAGFRAAEICGQRQSASLLRNAEYWQSEPDVGRVAHGVPKRVDRLRGLGNAVVPQVAGFIGRQIMCNQP